MGFWVSRILLSTILGVIVIYTIKKCESCNSYGVMNWKTASLLFLCVFIGVVVSVGKYETIDNYCDVVSILSRLICIWLLVTTSYMDQRSGKFHLYILVRAIILEVICLLIIVYGEGLKLSGACVFAILVFNVMFFINGILGTAWGDIGIWVVNQIVFLLANAERYVSAVFVMIMVLSICFVLRNLLSIVIGKWRLKKKMPLTMCISIGTYVSLFLYA